MSLYSQSAIREEKTQFARYLTLGNPRIFLPHWWYIEDWPVPIITVPKYTLCSTS